LAYAHLGLKSPDSVADLFNGQWVER
jgi:hypothetical protein